MTARRDFKRLVRARARKTGESYAAALRQLREAGLAERAAGTPPLRRVEKPELGFALHVPADWHEEPPDPFNGPSEVARFRGPTPPLAAGSGNLLVFRSRAPAGADAHTLARNARSSLHQRGFGHFAQAEALVAGVPGARLDYDMPTHPGGGRMWAVRHYFVVVGEHAIGVSFGTAAPEQDAALIDALAARIELIGPWARAAAEDERPPADRHPAPRPTAGVSSHTARRPGPYSARAHRVIQVAGEEAARRGHPAIDQEHLLLGVAQVPESAGLAVLAELGVSPERLRAAAEAVVAGGQTPAASVPAEVSAGGAGPRPNLTARAETMFSLAEQEALALKHAYVGVEHLLLAVLRQGDGPGYDALTGLGVRLGPVRDALRRFLDSMLVTGYTRPPASA